MGDRETYLNDAIAVMEGDPHCRVGKVSDFFNTKPVGPVEQDDFLNGCLELSTIYDPYELLEFLQGIENRAKRERKIFWGPRTLDLDIIFYDDKVLQEPNLVLPHPLMQERSFVLDPLVQIAPYAVHPVYHKTVRDLVRDLQTNTDKEDK
jgi:dihydroneopterin aldolase/2-amino-4-hydroxy-6-hydroxymethyldihydropteridine diphosphokinase